MRNPFRDRRRRIVLLCVLCVLIGLAAIRAAKAATAAPAATPTVPTLGIGSAFFNPGGSGVTDPPPTGTIPQSQRDH